MTRRVVGIDPGLTRCGVGVIDVGPTRSAALVYVGVVRSAAQARLGARLVAIADGVERLIDEYQPQAFAIEEVFAQHNVRTVIGVAQISGILVAAATRRGLPVGIHTPTQVKSAVTGYGRAGKAQVQAMVARILGLAAPPSPPDAADALAIALCDAWGGGTGPAGTGEQGAAGSELATPALRRWREAERKAGAGRRLGR
ncbi:MAG TPA: crossover junction endodeoxyribonuclease RuvC [Microbacteriaceae bacterium]|nr:crossover junction endodeoxyribonuclease RuvC [Microbacteriaceae bacterium]